MPIRLTTLSHKFRSATSVYYLVKKITAYLGENKIMFFETHFPKLGHFEKIYNIIICVGKNLSQKMNYFYEIIRS